MQWSHPETVGDAPPPSRAHTAILVDKKLVVYGGGQGGTYYLDVGDVGDDDTGSYRVSVAKSLVV